MRNVRTSQISPGLLLHRDHMTLVLNTFHQTFPHDQRKLMLHPITTPGRPGCGVQAGHARLSLRWTKSVKTT